MCIANKLKKNNKYVFISCRPQKTSVLGHKSGLKRDDRPSNHHADARSPGQPTPPFIPETLSVRGRDIIAALSNDRLVSKHWKKLFKAAPLKSMDAGLQQSNALYWRITNVILCLIWIHVLTKRCRARQRCLRSLPDHLSSTAVPLSLL